MSLRIALVANSLKRVEQELLSFYRMNREDISCYRKFDRSLIFNDGTILRGHTIQDPKWMKYGHYDQVFLTNDLEYCRPLMDLYYRMEQRSYVPAPYIFMTMEEL